MGKRRGITNHFRERIRSGIAPTVSVLIVKSDPAEMFEEGQSQEKVDVYQIGAFLAWYTAIFSGCGLPDEKERLATTGITLKTWLSRIRIKGDNILNSEIALWIKKNMLVETFQKRASLERVKKVLFGNNDSNVL